MVTVPGRRASNTARPRSIGTSRARLESLTVHWSTVESARSATNNTYSPMSAVSSAGRMAKEAGGGGGGRAGGGGGDGAILGAFESVHPKAPANSTATAERFMASWERRFHTATKESINARL